MTFVSIVLNFIDLPNLCINLVVSQNEKKKVNLTEFKYHLLAQLYLLVFHYYAITSNCSLFLNLNEFLLK